jgi:hypothetical protein
VTDQSRRYRLEDLPERIAAKIRINPDMGCWEHQGRPQPSGYARILWDGQNEMVHRIVYKLLVGPIPEDRPFLDHVHALGCRSKACCWPVHLEPVTTGENNRRAAPEVPSVAAFQLTKTHCPAGHEYTPENIYRRPSTEHRECRECHRERERHRRAGAA